MATKISIKINEVFKSFVNCKERYQIFYGGAGSGKSVFVAQRLILQCLNVAGHNFLIVRQTAKSNRQSTFALIQQIIKPFNSLFTVNKTDMTIACKHNQNKIAFAGLDDVEKLKSITFETGILTDIWIEEASEITEQDFNQLDLRLRGLSSVPLTITMTFNPIDVNFWAKTRFFDHPDNDCMICKTTYLNNKFIDEQYKKTLEKLKEIDQVYYNIYALGEWGIIGNTIYSNFIIHDFDYSHFSEFCDGLDFGFNHPSAYLRIAYQDNEIYVCNELYQSGLTNSELIERVGKQFDKLYHVIADSAEPDRIEEFKKSGYWCEPCIKGDSSVRAGIDWLKSKRIHINKTNCPNTANEIKTYKWREDRNGNVLEMPVNFKDDAMAALRYGVEDWRLRNNEPTTFETIQEYESGFERYY